jgi:hypothetical protein
MEQWNIGIPQHSVDFFRENVIFFDEIFSDFTPPLAHRLPAGREGQVLMEQDRREQF